MTASVFEASQLPNQNRVGPYTYVPTEWICILYIFLLSTVDGHDLILSVIHLSQALKFRLWWMLPTATFAGVLEILGWSARLWSSHSSKILTPYEMQLVSTIIAPTPLVAANFIIFGKIINQVGPQYSRINPKLWIPKDQYEPGMKENGGWDVEIKDPGTITNRFLRLKSTRTIIYSIGFELKVTIGHQEHSGKILLEDKQVMGSLEKSIFEGGIRKTPIC
ncbi:uncharacterized protein HD556DRAFT_1315021 [Suillus plorans]|uniref:Uncharacterized protein n=1 Tax=Suillus plorans TaxID=116603 RepID=A0A9P7A8Q9_9AGAM|nr:uncharacterized protein HD556DRAFT_1315021 [Suillus plorans]KAG1784509.1 hypothetical protein HD556DRAFT_1315021 [Suillus plorans]